MKKIISLSRMGCVFFSFDFAESVRLELVYSNFWSIVSSASRFPFPLELSIQPVQPASIFAADSCSGTSPSARFHRRALRSHSTILFSRVWLVLVPSASRRVSVPHRCRPRDSAPIFPPQSCAVLRFSAEHVRRAWLYATQFFVRSLASR
jgi:hypothetical protein